MIFAVFDVRVIGYRHDTVVCLSVCILIVTKCLVFFCTPPAGCIAPNPDLYFQSPRTFSKRTDVTVTWHCRRIRVTPPDWRTRRRARLGGLEAKESGAYWHAGGAARNSIPFHRRLTHSHWLQGGVCHRATVGDASRIQFHNEHTLPAYETKPTFAQHQHIRQCYTIRQIQILSISALWQHQREAGASPPHVSPDFPFAMHLSSTGGKRT